MLSMTFNRFFISSLLFISVVYAVSAYPSIENLNDNNLSIWHSLSNVAKKEYVFNNLDQDEGPILWRLARYLSCFASFKRDILKTEYAQYIAEYFQERGLDLYDEKIVQNFLMTALCIASLHGNTSIVTTLIPSIKKWKELEECYTALFWAVYFNHTPIVRLFLKEGLNPNRSVAACDVFVNNVSYSNQELLKKLMDQYAFKKKAHQVNPSLLMVAKKNQSLSMQDILLRHGATEDISSIREFHVEPDITHVKTSKSLAYYALCYLVCALVGATLVTVAHGI